MDRLKALTQSNLLIHRGSVTLLRAFSQKPSMLETSWFLQFEIQFLARRSEA